jgi:parallel beta-helix repeat protein
MPGRVEGTGTYFEVTDSNYLNITLESSEPVQLVLESVPEMVVIDIEAAEGASSTQITLTSFEASTTYYKYEDNYHNLVTFETDLNGSYSYTQDIAEPHVVFIQPQPSTRFIPTDTEIGIWNPVTRTYTLTTNVYETIQIDEDNLTLDGAADVGYTVTGPGSGHGIYLNGRTGVTIKNVNVQRFTWGIDLRNSSGNTLTGNTAKSNRYTGIELRYSGGNTLTGNTAERNGRKGILLSDSGGSILTGNTANYHKTYVSMVQCVGIGLWRSGGSMLTGNSASYNDIGIVINNSSGCTLTGNTASYNTFRYNLQGLGYYISASDSCTWRENSASNNDCGFGFFSCDDCTLIGNAATSSKWYGIRMSQCSKNILIGNTATNNQSGIQCVAASCNTLIGNTISDNNAGASFGADSIKRPSSNNLIYNNNFIDNGIQFSMDLISIGNVFNLDRPIGGNYWSEWTSPDNDDDGFVDYPYVVDSNNEDNFPWVCQDAWGVAPIWPACSTLTASDVGFTSLTLAWTPAVSTVGGIAEYLVFKEDMLLATVAGSETTYQVNGLEPNTEYSFKVEARDVADNYNANGPSLTVQTLTPLQAIVKLIGEVAALNLQQGIDNSLDAKLDAALGALDDINNNNDVAAINTLEAFINAVEAQSGDKIPDEANAAALIAAAQEIIAVLSAE